MNMNNNYRFGIGILFAVLLICIAPAAAENTIYFEPDPSSAAPGEEIEVTLWLNATDGSAAMNDAICFDPEVVNITSGSPGDFPLMWGFVHCGDSVRLGGWSSDGLNLTSGKHVLAYLTFVANNTGTSNLLHTDNNIGDQYGHDLPDQVFINGTFTCTGSSDAFTKPLASGWNLVSLPLTPDDNNASAVLTSISGDYDAVKSYNAATHQFEDTDTMDPGVGYFVHVTTAGTWEYEGVAYTSISAPLSQGLNCVGWTNEVDFALPGALSSIDGSYRYVARWNADDQKYEVYLPGVPGVFNDFEAMDQGEGYFIVATEGCTLTYP